MNARLWAIVMIGSVLAVGITAAAFAGNGLTGLRTELDKIGTIPLTSVMARVGDTELTVRQFERYKAFRKSEIELRNEGTVPPDETLLEEWITDELLYQKAAAENVVVSLDEARAEAQKARSNLEQMAPEARQFHQQVLQAMGVSEEQYWNELVPAEYRKMMSIVRLYEKLVKEGELHPPSGDPSDWSEQIRQYRQKLYRESLGTKVRIYS